MKRIISGVFAFTLLFSSFSAVMAQGTSPRPDVPSGGECWIQPVGFLSILSMLNKVEQVGWYGYVPFGTTQMSDLSRGDALSDEDVEGIEFTNRMLIACGNAASPLQVMALLDEQFQAGVVNDAINGNGVDSLVQYLPMFASQTAETEGIPALTVVDAWYAPETNKNILAVVKPYVADSETQPQFLVSYVYSIDRWLIGSVWLIEN